MLRLSLNPAFVMTNLDQVQFQRIDHLPLEEDDGVDCGDGGGGHTVLASGSKKIV